MRSDHLDSRNFGWNITSVALNINTLWHFSSIFFWCQLSIHSSAYPGPGRGGSCLSRDTQTSPELYKIQQFNLNLTISAIYTSTDTCINPIFIRIYSYISFCWFSKNGVSEITTKLQLGCKCCIFFTSLTHYNTLVASLIHKRKSPSVWLNAAAVQPRVSALL